MHQLKYFVFGLAILVFPLEALAGMDDFHPGGAIKEYGVIADVPAATPLPEGLVIKHSFDVMPGAEAGEINHRIETAARAINMHHAVGVPIGDIHLAVVLHGGSVLDVTNAEFHAARKDGAENANIGLIDALLGAGVRIIVCGQSATAQDVYKDDLLPGMELALSAITAHVLLQQEGYTLNPF